MLDCTDACPSNVDSVLRALVSYVHTLHKHKPNGRKGERKKNESDSSLTYFQLIL